MTGTSRALLDTAESEWGSFSVVTAWGFDPGRVVLEDDVFTPVEVDVDFDSSSWDDAWDDERCIVCGTPAGRAPHVPVWAWAVA